MRPRDTDFLFQSGNAFASSQSASTGIPDILGALRRRWRLVVSGALIGMMLAATYIALATPLYTSSVRIFLDATMNQNLQAQKIVEDRPVDTSLVDSQVQIISSESITLPVIKSMNLTNDREFVGPPKSIGAQIFWQIDGFMGRVKNALGFPPRFGRFFANATVLYPVHVTIRKSFGLMTRKLSVTKSRHLRQFLGTFSRKKSSVASANCPHVA